MLARSLALLLLLISPALAAPYSAFAHGEEFVYRVSWGIFGRAGEIRIRATRDSLEGREVCRLTVKTASKGFVRGLFAYEDVAEAFIDAADGRLLRATDVAQNGERSSDAVTVFDYEKRRAKHEDRARPGRNCEFDIPQGEAIDLISALVQTREWATEPGVKRDALIFAGRDIFPVTITAESFERIRVGRTETNTLLLVPRMATEEPRGIFKRGGEIKVWISLDGVKLPVRMQLKLGFGTATLHLVEHRLAESEQQG